jgi:hypothetical protein
MKTGPRASNELNRPNFDIRYIAAVEKTRGRAFLPRQMTV